MMSTEDFVNKVKDTQQKAERNKRRFGHGTPTDKLSTKKHSTNK
ncbi:DUF4023 domain-containing protein [Paenibacillus sp. GSMTC-2017]|nr:DUF4023 domain-containing protein [Paenibacillus sp. GSMTC-2017]MBH5319798.1 DUF4023 domain-containing protein [Paenibacillus sp. GSMTC-2017]